MRYWITKEGLTQLRDKTFPLDETELLVLSSLLSSSSGLATEEIVDLIGWKPEGEEVVLANDSIEDILNTLRQQGLVTVSRGKGTAMGYEASLPQTNIDYTSAMPNRTGSQFSIGSEYKPSKEFFLDKN